MSKLSMSKNSKILALLNFRLRITIQDGRMFVGQMIAFDKHMNVVLSECEEFRRVRPKGKPQTAPGTSTAQAERPPEREEKRNLGLVILRGENIVSISVEAPPPTADERLRGAGFAAGPGIGRPAGRGLPVAPMGAPGLAGPIRGVGGPAPGIMAPGARPLAAAPPVSYARPPMPGPGGPPMAGGPPPGFPGAPPPGFRPGMPLPPPPAGFRPGMPPPPGPGGLPAPPPGFRPPMPGPGGAPGFPPGFRPPQ